MLSLQYLIEQTQLLIIQYLAQSLQNLTMQQKHIYIVNKYLNFYTLFTWNIGLFSHELKKNCLY